MLFFIVVALFLTLATRADRPGTNHGDSHFQETELESLLQTCYQEDEGDLLVAASKINSQNLCRPILEDVAIEPARSSKPHLKSEPWTQEPFCLQKPNQTEDIC